jgi:thioredoxin-dependent peroxiredoxin
LVQKNDPAVDFTLVDQEGNERTLSTMLVDGPVVLFFYPAAMSAACTKESCHFRDLQSEFDELGAQPVGISMDHFELQAQFARKNGIAYPLLADVDGTVARRYNVKRSLNLLKVKRATFVINQDLTVREVINSEISMNAHADHALAALRAS